MDQFDEQDLLWRVILQKACDITERAWIGLYWIYPIMFSPPQGYWYIWRAMDEPPGYWSAICIHLFMIPRLIRNTFEKRRQKFPDEMILTALAIHFTELLILVHHNFRVDLAYSITTYITTTTWLAIQIKLLKAQQQLGPRFWIPRMFLPKPYEYQPILTMLNIKQDFCLSVLEGIRPENVDSAGIANCHYTCHICMSLVTVPVIMKLLTGLSIDNKDYAVTPCHHIFHAECLGQWLNHGIRCPMCWQVLPEMDIRIEEDAESVIS